MASSSAAEGRPEREKDQPTGAQPGLTTQDEDFLAGQPFLFECVGGGTDPDDGALAAAARTMIRDYWAGIRGTLRRLNLLREAIRDAAVPLPQGKACVWQADSDPAPLPTALANRAARAIEALDKFEQPGVPNIKIVNGIAERLRTISLAYAPWRRRQREERGRPDGRGLATAIAKVARECLEWALLSLPGSPEFSKLYAEAGVALSADLELGSEGQRRAVVNEGLVSLIGEIAAAPAVPPNLREIAQLLLSGRATRDVVLDLLDRAAARTVDAPGPGAALPTSAGEITLADAQATYPSPVYQTPVGAHPVTDPALRADLDRLTRRLLVGAYNVKIVSSLEVPTAADYIAIARKLDVHTVGEAMKAIDEMKSKLMFGIADGGARGESPKPPVVPAAPVREALPAAESALVEPDGVGPSSASPKTKARKEPHARALQAYRLHTLSGQTMRQIADTLSQEHGRTIGHGTVSKWIKQVKLFLAAGGVLPQPVKVADAPTPRVRTLDPDHLALGSPHIDQRPREHLPDVPE